MQMKISISERQKQKINQIAEELPDSVIVTELEPAEQPILIEEIMLDLGVSQYGETDKIIKKILINPAQKARREQKISSKSQISEHEKKKLRNNRFQMRNMFLLQTFSTQYIGGTCSAYILSLLLLCQHWKSSDKKK